jgi:hypothetical protein
MCPKWSNSKDKGMHKLYQVRSGCEAGKGQVSGSLLDPLHNQHVSHLFDGAYNILHLFQDNMIIGV